MNRGEEYFGLEGSGDPKHAEKVLITTSAVITEVVYLLDFGAQTQINFLNWFLRGALTLLEIKQHEYHRLVELFIKYSDLPIDFAVASLVLLSENL